jgi:hypothetical protein
VSIIWCVRVFADKWTSALRLVAELAFITDVILHYRCNIAKRDSDYHAVGSRLMRSDVYFRFNSLLWSTLSDFLNHSCIIPRGCCHVEVCMYSYVRIRSSYGGELLNKSCIEYVSSRSFRTCI